MNSEIITQGINTVTVTVVKYVTPAEKQKKAGAPDQQRGERRKEEEQIQLVRRRANR